MKHVQNLRQESGENVNSTDCRSIKMFCSQCGKEKQEKDKGFVYCFYGGEKLEKIVPAFIFLSSGSD